jgi:sugar phosphate permease
LALDRVPSERWLHIIPVAFIMYTIAFIDRTNISMALPSMSRDLHMSPTQAGDAAGIFFWGYMFLQIPGGYIAQRWSAKWFVSFLLVLWGLCSMGCGFVETTREFWFMRFFLGVAEGGVWPAVLILLAHWFPRPERARANAYWMLCLPVAVVFSSPLSGWILGHWNWRVLLIAEGALPFVWLVVWFLFINDHPHQARWISDDERDHLADVLGREAQELEATRSEAFLKALFRPQVILLVVVYFLTNTGNYGYLFWLPTALENARKMSSQLVGVLFAIPYFVTGIGMVLISRHSDQTRERRGHVAFALAWAGACMMSCVMFSGSMPLLAFATISMFGAGAYGMLGPFWAIPTETLPRAVTGTAMGLVNALGNLGGYFGPVIVGFLMNRTGNFRVAFGLISLGYFAAAALTLVLRQPARTRE